MGHGFKRVPDDEWVLGIGRRKPKIELEKRPGYSEAWKNSWGKRGTNGFATLGHNKLTTWGQVKAAQGHNERTSATPNARDDAPEPIELLAGAEGSYIDL